MASLRIRAGVPTPEESKSEGLECGLGTYHFTSTVADSIARVGLEQQL